MIQDIIHDRIDSTSTKTFALKILRVLNLKQIEYFILFGFLCFSLVGILNHEMWRDELQAWMLARDSDSLSALLYNMRYEGHPALWHSLLFALSAFTHNPLIMQLLHWVISVLIVFLILKFSPFTTLHKFLFVFSYFIFYEYTFISRSYNLTILFATLFCIFWGLARKRYLGMFVSLALMANTNAYGLLLSLIFFGFLVLEKRSKLRNLIRPTRFPNSFTLGLGILAFAWSCSFWQIGRAKSHVILEKLMGLVSFSLARSARPTLAVVDVVDFFEDEGFLSSSLKHLGDAVKGIWDSYIPVPPLFQLDFWDRNILQADALRDIGINISDQHDIRIFLSILLILSFVLLFWKQRNVCLTYLGGSLLFIGFQTFIYERHSLRHQGLLFSLLIFCYWLYLLKSDQEKGETHTIAATSNNNRLLSLLLTGILLLQAIAGIYAGTLDYLYPFSAGKAAAEFISTNELMQQDLIGSRDRQVSVVSGYLDAPIYFLERKEYGSFWDKGEPEITSEDQLVQEIKAAMETLDGENYTVILNKPLTRSETLETDIELLAEFDRAIVSNEVFYIYSARS